MYPAYTQLVAKCSSPSIGDQRATGCGVQVRGVLLLALNWLAMNIGLGIGLAALLRDLPLKVFNST